MKSGASFGEAVSVAAASLRTSKLRSFLTLLGIILATTTLIAVVSVINGMDLYIAKQVSSMGADGFRVVRMAMIGNFDAKKYLEMQRRNPQLTVEEYDFVKSRVTLVKRHRHRGQPQRPGALRDQPGRGRAGAGGHCQHWESSPTLRPPWAGFSPTRKTSGG